jgi:DNA polymerase eta
VVEEEIVEEPIQVQKESLTTCPECGKKLPESNLQSHLDFHLALKLSQEQREVFRKEVKNKIQTQSPAQKPKSKAKALPSLAKFLVKAPEAQSTSDTRKCNECGRNIPIGQFNEHVDYHAAKRLQIELNKQEMRTVTSNNLSTNKRKRDNSGTSSPSAKVKSLSSFFTRNK